MNLINGSTTALTKRDDEQELLVKGIPSSPGLVLGRAVVIAPQPIFVISELITLDEISVEIERFRTATKIFSDEIRSLISKSKSENRNILNLLETNLFILQDKFLIDSIENLISDGLSAEMALVEEFDTQKQFLLNSQDSLIKERSIEFDQIKHRLISILRNQNTALKAGKGSIIVCQSITPAEVIKIHEVGVVGIITEIGGISSHSAILARSYDIAQVIGVKDITSQVNNGDFLIIDGNTGIIQINPSEESLVAFTIKKKKEKEHKKLLGKLIKLPATTLDGKEIILRANINFPEDMVSMQTVGAYGAGLVRTEHLVIQRGKFPSLEEQQEWYDEIAHQSYPHPVTLRIFDIGSDKIAEGLPIHENNPALGLRGIRFLLQRIDILKTQISAILRASKLKNVRILLPMLSSIEELEQTIQVIDDCKANLKELSIPFDEMIQIGVMIETPGAALIAEELATKCDFFSIGTNDLTQYTLAADRTNELIAHHFDTFHPAVLKLILMAITAAKNHNIKASICGEMAGHAAATSLLIGMGIDELSIVPSILLEIKKRIRTVTDLESIAFANSILSCNSVIDIHKKLGLM